MNSSPPERGPDHDAQDSGRKRGSRRRPPLPSTLLPGSGDVGGNTTAAPVRPKPAISIAQLAGSGTVAPTLSKTKLSAWIKPSMQS